MPVVVFISFVVVLLLILMVAGVWATFSKAGESGWKALIPVYNNYIMLRLGGNSGWWVLAYLPPFLPALIGFFTTVANAQTQGLPSSPQALPEPGGLLPALGGGVIGTIIMTALLGFVIYAVTCLYFMVSVVMIYDLVRSFGKGMGFTWGLLALPFIFWPMLGFGNAKYRGPVTNSPSIADETDGNSPDGGTQQSPPPRPNTSQQPKQRAQQSQTTQADTQPQSSEQQQTAKQTQAPEQSQADNQPQEEDEEGRPSL